jgi:hypoxanthine phosphoribosyltransferase
MNSVTECITTRVKATIPKTHEQVVVDGDLEFVPLIRRNTIQQKVKELANCINRDYRHLNPILVGVLNGSFIFLADLIREVTIPCEMDFIKISSYEKAMRSSGVVTIKKDFDCQVKDRHILIIEDIVDSGLSIRYLKQKFLAEKPTSLKFMTLFMKPDSVKIDFSIDYVGFEIANDFIIGYGLDHDQRWRNLKDVYVLSRIIGTSPESSEPAVNRKRS